MGSIGKKKPIAWIVLTIILISVASFFAYALYDVESKYEILQQKYETLQSDFSSLSANYTRLQTSYHLLYSNYTYLRQNYISLQTNYTNLKNSYDSLLLDYESLSSDYNNLRTDYNSLVSNYNNLVSKYNDLVSRYDEIFTTASQDATAVTLVYHTDFGNEMHILSLSIPYDLYEFYHEKPHPVFSTDNPEAVKAYITPNDTVIQDIVSVIRSQTESEEELADALLDLVQYKGYTLSVRYYVTNEFKHPIETLVEMGGDCDTHAVLYASLLKAAGFKVLFLISTDGTHAAVAVHLTDPPTHNTQSEFHYFEYNGERYYYAETTGSGWMVGDLPPDLEGTSFYLVQI